jgi:DNA-binding MarR family transcriptional regulator
VNDTAETPAKALEQLRDEVLLLALSFKRLPFAVLPQDDLMIAGAGVLSVLAEQGGRTVPQLGRLRSTSRQNIQIMVNRLAAARCVEIVSNPKHKRSPLVRLTAKGRETLAARQDHETRVLVTVSRHFASDELATAAGVLVKLRTLLGERDQKSQPQTSTPREASNSKGRKEDQQKQAEPREEPTPSLSPPAGDEENSLPVNLL